jgi:phosphotriesterase-related protein
VSQVATVRGPVSTAELGPAYMHEHIFTLTADVQQNYPQEWGSEEARVADAARRLRALAAQGITTIVDPTVVGLGRYIPRIQRVAEQVPELNIIVATGLYTYDSVPFFFRFGLNVETTFEARADTLVEMCRRGYAGSMVLSQDASCYIDWIDPAVQPFLAQWHYLHIGDEVLPYARDRGVTDGEITTMLVDNPRRFFETAAGSGG